MPDLFNSFYVRNFSDKQWNVFSDTIQDATKLIMRGGNIRELNFPRKGEQ